MTFLEFFDAHFLGVSVLTLVALFVIDNILVAWATAWRERKRPPV